jgi:GrpB-like predicted nucleotidyltransferase (UPF0157 family)
MKVEVVKSNPRWLKEFNSEKLRLNEYLGDLVENNHHIGSTSVPDLAAKPIIDIIIEVSSLDALDKLSPVMKSLDDEAKGEFGIPGRRYFTKGGSNRSHQIHAFKTGDENVKRHTAFRDYLKSHPEVLREYADLKRDLAKVCNNDIERYCDGKDEFIKHYEIKALEWANNT